MLCRRISQESWELGRCRGTRFFARGSPLCGDRSFLIRENPCGRRYSIGCRVECDSFSR
jgi:hypothetical protein